MCDTTFHQAVRIARDKVSKIAIFAVALLMTSKALAEDILVELDPNGFCVWCFLHDLWECLNGLIC